MIFVMNFEAEQYHIKKASSECLEKRAGEGSWKSFCDKSGSLSWLILCTEPHPQHGCRHSSMCVIIKELLKVKAGIRQISLWLWWNNVHPPLWFINTQHAAVPALKWELTLVQRVICLVKYASNQLLWPKASGFQFLHWILWSIAKSVQKLQAEKERLCRRSLWFNQAVHWDSANCISSLSHTLCCLG